MKLQFVQIANGRGNVQLTAESMREEQSLHDFREQLRATGSHGAASITGENRVQWLEFGTANIHRDRVLL